VTSEQTEPTDQVIALPAQVGVGTRYSEEVKQTAFELWAFECDRNQKRTASRLASLLEPGSPCPTPQIVGHWVRTQGWDFKADQAIAAIAPNLRARQLSRLVVLGNDALSTFAQVLSGEIEGEEKHTLQAKVAVAQNVLTLLGLGTAQGRGDAPKLTVVQEDREDLAALSPQELARRQRDRLQAAKEARR
jgi:hypothetical protein